MRRYKLATLNKEDLDLLQQKITIAQSLKDRQYSWMRGLIANEFRVAKDSASEDALRKTTARTYLALAGQLHGQILNAISESNLLLALIGLRSLLESIINTRYIFCHPKHVDDMEWINNNCIDLINRSHDNAANKSRLGDVDIRQRAEAISTKQFSYLALYDKVFSYLCNFTHPNYIALQINENNKFKETTFMATQLTLIIAHDVGDALCKFFNIKKDLTLENDLKIFADECIKLAGVNNKAQ